jgi:hypothetical protein
MEDELTAYGEMKDPANYRGEEYYLLGYNTV